MNSIPHIKKGRKNDKADFWRHSGRHSGGACLLHRLCLDGLVPAGKRNGQGGNRGTSEMNKKGSKK